MVRRIQVILVRYSMLDEQITDNNEKYKFSEWNIP